METVRFNLKSRFLFVLSISFIVVLALLPKATADLKIFDSGWIDWGDHRYKSFEAEDGEMILVKFHTLHHLDVLLIDWNDYSEYSNVASQGQGTFDYHREESRLNAARVSWWFTIPHAGTYAFIVDNTPEPGQGASSGKRVSFSLSVMIWSTSEAPDPPDDYGWVFGMIGVSLVLVAVGVFLLLLLDGRRKSRMVMPVPVQAEERGAGPVTCPNCSNLVRTGVYCTKCGERFQ